MAAALLVGGGCGRSSGSPPPDYAKALQHAPPPLAKLYSQANDLIPGGMPALENRIDRLRGYPVVVNVWASWCGGCLYEFPFLQEMSARFGIRVAFLGVDSQDSGDSAAAWLEEAPVRYPSYSDPEHELAESLAVVGIPDTAFYDKEGELVWLRQGNYRDAGELEADIKKYALGAS